MVGCRRGPSQHTCRKIQLPSVRRRPLSCLAPADEHELSFVAKETYPGLLVISTLTPSTRLTIIKWFFTRQTQRTRFFTLAPQDS